MNFSCLKNYIMFYLTIVQHLLTNVVKSQNCGKNATHLQIWEARCYQSFKTIIHAGHTFLACKIILVFSPFLTIVQRRL